MISTEKSPTKDTSSHSMQDASAKTSDMLAEDSRSTVPLRWSQNISEAAATLVSVLKLVPVLVNAKTYVSQLLQSSSPDFNYNAASQSLQTSAINATAEADSQSSDTFTSENKR